MITDLSKKLITLTLTGFILAGGLLIMIPPVQSQVSEAGVLFLLIPPGARHNGMGQSGVSTVRDANAIYYNPGALAFSLTPDQPRSIEFMHVNWLPGFNLDMFYDYGSMAWYLDDIGVVGANITFFNLGEQELRDDLNQYQGKINSFDMSLGASYATKITDTWGIGGNLKFIYSKLANKSSTAEKEKGTGSSVAIDVGVMKKNLFIHDLTFGASIANIGPKITYVDEAQADPLPTLFRAGLSYPAYKDDYNTITACYEINRLIVRGTSKGSQSLIYSLNPFSKKFYTKSALFTTWSDNGWHRLGHNIGIEYTYSDFLALRSGTALDVAGKLYDLNFGAGIKYSMFNIDFAYTTKLSGDFNARDGSQFYSIGVNF